MKHTQISGHMAQATKRFRPAGRLTRRLALIYLTMVLFNSALLAQELSQPSFQHEVRGTAQLESTDSGLIVRNLGNGAEDRVALIVGNAPTDPEYRWSFLTELADNPWSLPVGGGIRYHLFGTVAGGAPEVFSAMRVGKVDTTVVMYEINFDQIDEIVAKLGNKVSFGFDTNRLAFSVRSSTGDSAVEQVDCGCFREGSSAGQVCVWEIRWTVPVEIVVPGSDTTYHYDRIRISGVRPDPFPEFVTSLELSTDGLPAIRVVGEGVHRGMTAVFQGQEEFLHATGRTRMWVTHENRVAVTGFEDGRRDGVTLRLARFEGPIAGISMDVDADLRNPKACIFSTYRGNLDKANADTLGYVGLVRDSIGIRVLANTRSRGEDSAFVSVSVEDNIVDTVWNTEVLGWILDDARVLEIECEYSAVGYRGRTIWTDMLHAIRFDRPITFRREPYTYVGSSVEVRQLHADEAFGGIGYDPDITSVHISAADIDTITLGLAQRDVLGVPEAPIEFNINGFLYWPNPVNDMLHVVGRDDVLAKTVRFAMHDLVGRLIAEGPIESSKREVILKCGDLTSGVYMLVLSGEYGEVVASMPVIKE